MFGSFITKQDNVLDQRIQDYKKDPLAALVETDNPFRDFQLRARPLELLIF